MAEEIALPQLGTVQLISNARRALAEAKTLPDVQRVMAIAQTAADAGRRAAKLLEAQGMAAEIVDAANEAANDAASVRIEAQARAGEMLREMPKNPGGQRSESRDRQSRQQLPTTAEVLNMNEDAARMASARWQRVADIPEEVRQEYVEETKAEKGEVTTAGLLRYAAEQREPEPRPPSEPSVKDSLEKAYVAVSEAIAVLGRYRNAGAIAAYAADSRRKTRFRELVNRARTWLDEAEQILK